MIAGDHQPNETLTRRKEIPAEQHQQTIGLLEENNQYTKINKSSSTTDAVQVEANL